MDDNQNPPDSNPRPHLSLERQLAVGPHIYQLTATAEGDESIGLSLVGWNASGEVVSEISGGISPADLAPVAEALTSTLAGLAALRRHRLTSPASSPAAAPAVPPRRHRNQGVRWSAEDDDRLATRHRAGATPRELMEEFGRSRGGITARLVHLGLITPDGAAVAARGEGGPSVPAAARAQGGPGEAAEVISEAA